MYAQNSILCQFGNLEICPNFANPYFTQFSSISGGNCINDDNSGFDDNNEPSEPPLDDINPPGPAANDTVHDDTDTNNNLPIPNDGESQGGVSTGTEDDDDP